MKNILDDDLNAYGHELRLKAEANLDEYYRENTGLSLKELRKHLEEHIISEVRQAVIAWRGAEDEKLAMTFETACKRFIIKSDEMVDSLLKFSSELFAIPYDAVKTEELWSAESRLYYKFTEQPVGLEIITSSLTLSLPKFIGEKIVIRKMKEYLHRVITIQLCRIGSDFEQRLTKSKLDFKWEMLQRIEATIEGIGAAIKKGMSQRSKGEKEATERKNEVSDILTRLDTVKDRLMKLRDALGVIRKC
jgi:hypothetical protein